MKNSYRQILGDPIEHPGMELVRAVGGISWAVGLLMLLIEPVLGVLILGVAAVLTIWSVVKTRERRHQELLDAARKPSS